MTRQEHCIANLLIITQMQSSLRNPIRFSSVVFMTIFPHDSWPVIRLDGHDSQILFDEYPIDQAYFMDMRTLLVRNDIVICLYCMRLCTSTQFFSFP